MHLDYSWEHCHSEPHCCHRPNPVITVSLVLFEGELMMRGSKDCSPLRWFLVLFFVFFPFQRSLPARSTWLQASSWPTTWSTQSSRSLMRIVMTNSVTRSSSASWRTGCTAATGWDNRDHLNALCASWMTVNATRFARPVSYLLNSSVRKINFHSSTGSCERLKTGFVCLWQLLFKVLSVRVDATRSSKMDPWMQSQVRFKRINE